MGFAQQLQEWIDWARERIDPAQPWKLSIGQKRLPAPWLGDPLIELYDDLAADQELPYITDACDEAMVASGNDIAVRFVSLHLHYCLLRMSRVRVETEPEDSADQDDILLQAVIPALKHVVAFLPTEDIPRSWPRFRWEILNSYAAGLWDRALGIFELSERSGLIPVQHLRLMRGHVRYLLAVWADSPDDPADDLIWDPRVLGSREDVYPPAPMSTEDADQMVQATMFASAVHVPAFKPIAPEHIDTLRDAPGTTWKRPLLPGQYPQCLKRCWLGPSESSMPRPWQRIITGIC
jgi:hypothetical protein